MVRLSETISLCPTWSIWLFLLYGLLRSFNSFCPGLVWERLWVVPLKGRHKNPLDGWMHGWMDKYIHGDSIKTKPNCLCHIYLMPDHIILKLSSYLENWTNKMIPTIRNILFSRLKDLNVWSDCRVRLRISAASLLWCSLRLRRLVVHIWSSMILTSFRPHIQQTLLEITGRRCCASRTSR